MGNSKVKRLVRPLYSSTVSKVLRQPSRRSFSGRGSAEASKIHPLRRQAMYACIPENGYGFFEGVCTPRNATAHSCDPPPPRNTKEPEPWQWDSGPKWITSRATVDDALAWGRGKPPPAHCPSTAHMPPTHHAEYRTRALQSIACRCAPRRNLLL